jgi:exopolysaccharide biosynthesis polyprenyl glycosylphosphotransferase
VGLTPPERRGVEHAGNRGVARYHRERERPGAAGTAVTAAGPPRDASDPATVRAATPPAGEPDRAHHRPGLEHRLVAVDAVALVAGWSAGWVLGHGGRGAPLAAPDIGLAMIAVGVVATVACAGAAGLYRPPVNGIRAGALGRLVRSTGLAAGIVVLWQAVVGDAAPRLLLGGVAGALVATVAARCGFDVWLIRRRERGELRTAVVVAGDAADARALVDHLRLYPEAGLHACAVVGERRPPGEQAGDGPPWLGGFDDALEAVRRTGAGGVLVAVNGLAADDLNRLVGGLWRAGVPVRLSTGLTGICPTRLRTSAVAHEPVVVVGRPHHPAVQRIAKRAIDIVVASVLLVAAAPVIGVAAAVIKAHDRGPVLFRQVRIGRDGRPFRLLKMRTMEVEAEARLAELRRRNERHGPLFKVSDDPRITPVGAFLRSTAMDELPQLVHVLTGRMSIVGPRPALPAETAEFDDELRRRLLVRPGLTGLWQVEANHKASFEEYRRLDLFYVDNWSVGMDVAVMADTVQAVSRRVLRALRRPVLTAPAPVGAPSVPDAAEVGP